MLVMLGYANDDLQLHVQEDVCAALALQLSAKNFETGGRVLV